MILKALMFVLILVVAKHMCKINNGFGYDRQGYISRPGKCSNVQPIDTGSEDIGLAGNGLAFISSGFHMELCRYAVDARIFEYTGRIYLFDFNRPERGAEEVTLPDEIRDDFSPHGLSIWEDPETGDIRLFVVNHGIGGDTVEVLRFNKKTVSFSLVKSVRSDLFVSLNDIVAVGPDSFYAANDGYLLGCWRVLEILLNLPFCRLVYYDGEKVSTILDGVQDLNSLAVSGDGKELYLTRPFGKRVDIFNISKTDFSLDFSRSIHTGLGIDNVFVDRLNGDLWFGGHPSIFLMASHFGNIDVPAPSQVIRIHPTGPKTDPFASYKMYSPFGDDGDLISGSSSAVHYQNKILIGSVVNKAVYCEINPGQM